MKINSVNIHNFRSIKDAKFDLYDYSLFIGANNTGKTNIMRAIRVFYEDNVRFNEGDDFPKFSTDDDESWIEIEYKLKDEEYETLKEEYRGENNSLKVRKYLKSSDKDRVKQRQSNIYGYENGELSNNLFYGARNISQAKLGKVIYIPEITQTSEALKLSGPSPLRNLINFVVERVIKSSESFSRLEKAFQEFDNNFKKEKTEEGFSLFNLVNDINDNLREWNVIFQLNINPIEERGIVKNLVTHDIIDNVLDKEVDIENLGQGLQRHIIYTLLRLSPRYAERKVYERREFSPELALLLFEEPEAFLHPNQQECLNISLKTLSSEDGQQIIVSTHSPIFVSRNVEDLPSLIKFRKDNGITKIFQIDPEINKIIIAKNSELAVFLREKLENPSVEEEIKEVLRRKLGSTEDGIRMEEESIRYLLWLDATRCSTFFVDIVLICEGATERIFIDYLINNEWQDLREKRACVLDAGGKFNIHRYMNLFRELGISHSVLLDRDENEHIHRFINEFIQGQINEYTKKIDFFERDIESFLGIGYPPENRRDKKPLNVMWHYFQNKIEERRLEELKDKIESLFS